jgi:plastocyanin
VSHPSSRAAALLLTLGVGLLGACSDGGGDATGAAASTSEHTGSGHTGNEHSESTAAESSAPAADAFPSAAPSSAVPSSAVPSSAAPEAASPPAAARSVTATEGEMYIELSESSFTPGSYTIEVVNEGNATHDLVVERDGADVAATENIAPGASATLTVTLEEGDYVFYCSIGNHRAMGMEIPVAVGA